MGFLTTQVSLPLWLLIIMIAGMVPVFLKLYRFFKSRGLLGRKDNIIIDSQMKTIAPILKEEEGTRKSKRPVEVKILKLLATKGDQGILLQSIADLLKIDSNSANRALNYLSEKSMVESVNSMAGNKYYLTTAGKKYCTTKGYMKTAA